MQKNDSFQLVRTAFPSSFFLFFFFFAKIAGFLFFQGARVAIIGLTPRAFEFQTDATIRLAIFFKELLENMGEFISKADSQLKRRRYA